MVHHDIIPSVKLALFMHTPYLDISQTRFSFLLQTLMDSSHVPNISRSLSEAAAAVYGQITAAQEEQSTSTSSVAHASAGQPHGADFTQLPFLDSPRSTSSNGFPTRRKGRPIILHCIKS